MAAARGADPGRLTVQAGEDLAVYLAVADIERWPEFGRRYVPESIWED